MLIAFIPEIMVCDGDRPAFFKKFRAAGGHGLRAHAMESWSAEILLPWKQATYNGQPVRIVESGVDSPVADLTQENPDYWTRFAWLCSALKAADLFLLLSLGDQCSQNTHQQFFTYPFLGGVQTLSDSADIRRMVVPQEALKLFPGSPGGLYGVGKYPLFAAWIKRAIAVARATGVELYVEPQNEFSRMDWAATDPHPENWYKMIVNEIVANGVPLDHIIHSGNYEIEKNYLGLWSQHGVVRPTFAGVPGIDYSRALLSGDGGLNGASSVDVDVDGYRGLSVDDAVTLAGRINDLGIVGYEWMSRLAYRFDQCRANVDGVPMDVPAAMAAAFK
jgi:hypothetical protein